MTKVSAPGKILLGGEYAVLFGAEAVVSAVNRRAEAAYFSEAPQDTSSIVLSVLAEASSFLNRRGIRISSESWVSVTSSGFRIGKLKLGLGSSAAVAASAVGAVFEAHGLSIRENLIDIFSVAQSAHRAAQQGRGSGADVAASVLGNTILFSVSKTPTPISLAGIHIAVVFSGRSVSTEEMIGHVADFKKRDPKEYEACMNELTNCAGTLATAYRSGIARDIIRVSGMYGECMDRLGRASRVNIVTKEHRCAMTLANKLGGTAKPSGAGGGDIAVAFFDSKEALREFRVQCIRHELVPLDLEVNAPGLRVEP